MKKFILPIIAFVFLASLTSPSLAQDSTKVDNSLYGQYQQLQNKSKSYYGNKIVAPARLSGFWRNVNDTLKTERKQLRAAKVEIGGLKKNITDLNAQIQGKESALSNSNQKLNEISFMGITFEKSTYNSIVWTLIIILAIALAFVIIRSARHIHEAKYRSELYEEIATEYQSYKVKANEKEKKLARELQDERNKLDDYKSRER